MWGFPSWSGSAARIERALTITFGRRRAASHLIETKYWPPLLSPPQTLRIAHILSHQGTPTRIRSDRNPDEHRAASLFERNSAEFVMKPGVRTLFAASIGTNLGKDLRRHSFAQRDYKSMTIQILGFEEAHWFWPFITEWNFSVGTFSTWEISTVAHRFSLMPIRAPFLLSHLKISACDAYFCQVCSLVWNMKLFHLSTNNL